MINILKTGNAIVIDFTDNDKYLNNGTIEVAPNELMVVIDESNMATFKKMSNGDTLFGLLIDLIQIQGEAVTKDNIIDKFGMIGFASVGGSVDSVNGQTGDVVITATSLGAITKADADATYASKTELEEKQDTLVSGTNVKTINGESILGEGNIEIQLSELPIASADTLGGVKVGAGLSINPEGVLSADSPLWDNISGKPEDIVNITERLASKLDTATYDSEKSNFATKDELNSKSDASALSSKLDTLVSGTNIKTINGESILGEGDLTISSESRTWRFTYSSSITSGNLATITPDGFNSLEWLNQVAIGDLVYLDKGQEFMKLSVSNIYHPKAGNITVGLSFYSDRLYWILVAGNSFNLNINTVPQGETAGKTTLGVDAEASGYGVAIGKSAKANGYNSIVIGNHITENYELAINIGNRIKADKAGNFIYFDNGDKVLKDELAKKLNTLVSGTSIKTINGESILGEGDITIQGEITVDTEMSDTSENAVQNKVIKAYIDSLVGNILTQLQEINGTN